MKSRPLGVTRINSLVQYLGRFLFFLRRHGALATFARIGLEFQRLRKCGRMVLFCCDLGGIAQGLDPTATHGHSIEHVRTASQLDAGDRAQILNSGNPLLISLAMEERFAKGASLWLYNIYDRIAAFGWTLVGHTIEPHFFPLNPEDVHLFDFFVFPEHRGKRINPMLVNVILERMSYVSKGRAYIECAEWNQPQLASLKRTPFQRIGVAGKLSLFSKTSIAWSAEPGRVESTRELQKRSNSPADHQ